MYILLKLDHTKLGVSSLFLSNVIEKETFEGLGSTPPPLVKEELTPL